MNSFKEAYKETRKRLIKRDPKLKRLPEEWERRLDLRGADLRGANLCSANLRGAYLSGANLCSANLQGADLQGADLQGADLRNTNLLGTFLQGACLSRADLQGALINWESHDLVAELLKREANNEPDKLKLAGLVLLMRAWCWDKFLEMDDPLKRWALGALAKYVREGDNAPEELLSSMSGPR